MQFQKTAYNVKQLLKDVNLAFENLHPQSLRFVLITLQDCMIEVIKRKSGFDYRIPHMNKTKQVREETLLDQLSMTKAQLLNNFKTYSLR